MTLSYASIEVHLGGQHITNVRTYDMLPCIGFTIQRFVLSSIKSQPSITFMLLLSLTSWVTAQLKLTQHFIMIVRILLVISLKLSLTLKTLSKIKRSQLILHHPNGTVPYSSNKYRTKYKNKHRAECSTVSLVHNSTK